MTTATKALGLDYLDLKTARLRQAVIDREAYLRHTGGMPRYLSKPAIRRAADELNGQLRLAFYLGWVNTGDDREARVKAALFRAEQVTR